MTTEGLRPYNQAQTKWAKELQNKTTRPEITVSMRSSATKRTRSPKDSGRRVLKLPMRSRRDDSNSDSDEVLSDIEVTKSRKKRPDQKKVVSRLNRTNTVYSESDGASDEEDSVSVEHRAKVRRHKERKKDVISIRKGKKKLSKDCSDDDYSESEDDSVSEESSYRLSRNSKKKKQLSVKKGNRRDESSEPDEDDSVAVSSKRTRNKKSGSAKKIRKGLSKVTSEKKIQKQQQKKNGDAVDSDTTETESVRKKTKSRNGEKKGKSKDKTVVKGRVKKTEKITKTGVDVSVEETRKKIQSKYRNELFDRRLPDTDENAEDQKKGVGKLRHLDHGGPMEKLLDATPTKHHAFHLGEDSKLIFDLQQFCTDFGEEIWIECTYTLITDPSSSTPTSGKQSADEISYSCRWNVLWNLEEYEDYFRSSLQSMMAIVECPEADSIDLDEVMEKMKLLVLEEWKPEEVDPIQNPRFE